MRDWADAVCIETSAGRPRRRPVARFRRSCGRSGDPRAGSPATRAADGTDPGRVPDHSAARREPRSPGRRRQCGLRRSRHPRDPRDDRRRRSDPRGAAPRRRSRSGRSQAVPGLQRQHQHPQLAVGPRHPRLLRRVHRSAPRTGPGGRRRASALAAGRVARRRHGRDHRAWRVGRRGKALGRPASPQRVRRPHPDGGVDLVRAGIAGRGTHLGRVPREHRCAGARRQAAHELRPARRDPAAGDQRGAPPPRAGCRAGCAGWGSAGFSMPSPAWWSRVRP